MRKGIKTFPFNGKDLAMPQSDNILVQNIGFFRRMRNYYYEKSGELFHKLENGIHENKGEADKTMELLQQYIEVMELTNEYARNTVRGYKRKKLKMFRQDPESGIMEEEIVFVCFLEELLSSSIYLRNRFETNDYVRQYMDLIKSRENYVGDKSGFLDNILLSLEAYQKADHEEILQISKLIRKRFLIANNIFAILRRHEITTTTAL